MNQLVRMVEHQAWLDAPTEGAQRGLLAAYRAGGDIGQRLKNALHGVWLGHSLHQVVVAVPIGAWSTAALLDMAEARGNRRYRAGTDTAISYGLVGAVVAALTGATDWTGTDGAARRVGAVHALLNYGVVGLYTASWVQRRAGNRAAGRRLAWTGYTLAGASAYLGGHLVAAQRIGVNHAPDTLPDCTAQQLTTRQIVEDVPTRIEIDGTPVAAVRRGESVYALAAACSHLGGPLDQGELRGRSIVCPWHGSRFALEDGRVLDGPATMPQPCLALRIRNV